MVQVGRAVTQGGRGLARVGIGLAQYAVIATCGLGVLTTAVAAADALAKAILTSGLKVDSWAGLNDRNGVLEGAVEGVSGIGLGLIALFCVIPAAVAWLVLTLVRSAAVLVLAGTFPILAAGLIADATRRWFWLGLRWMMALLLMTPTMAFTVVIGMKVAEGAAGAQGQQQDPVQAALSAVIAGVVLIIAACCPLALFKLFAWVDPNSVAGASVRGFFGGHISTTATAGGGVVGSSESSAAMTAQSRYEQLLDTMDAAGPWAAGIAGQASGLLDAVGAGHAGGPGLSTRGHAAGTGDADDGDSPEDRGGPAGDDEPTAISASPGQVDTDTSPGLDLPDDSGPSAGATAVPPLPRGGDHGAESSLPIGGDVTPAPGEAAIAEVGGAEAAAAAL
jgi:hypothetical protein